MTKFESEMLQDILFTNMKILNIIDQSKLGLKCCSTNMLIRKKWPKNKNKIKRKSGAGFFIQNHKKLKNMVVSGNLYKIARIKNDQFVIHLISYHQQGINYLSYTFLSVILL
ncbi:hypothetical protein ABPG74_015867 [Tetrahymena malaccensis]